ncbi:ComEA family DNA-binding protein [Mumia flava]|uniref:ComEA family DNA-binding protein n=1 Tax=Mumia flava TaxID=1348852 RepID=UPI001FE7D8C5|nr:ComEA family DNA-binding protein [Mumia flava]
MERRSSDRGAEAARRRLELLARELAGSDATWTGFEPDDEPDDEPDRLDPHDGVPSGRAARAASYAHDRAGAGAGRSERRGSAVASLLGAGVEVRHLVAVAIVLAVLAGGIGMWVASARPQEVPPSDSYAVLDDHAVDGPSSPAASAAAVAGTAPAAGGAADAATVVVDVTGKVRRPQVVSLPTGSRVMDAVEAAGGARRGADLSSLNLARVLVDGEQVVVGLEAVAAPVGGASGAGTAPAPVNLNTATAEDLDTLPGVGPVTAQAILDWRSENGSFSSVEQLLDVSGIGEATLDELRDLVTV